jgi:AcrR family transcriptional regulator
MKKKSDKTKKLLGDTLVKLMSEKDFDKISVKDLTDKLDINRGTFYLHFKDKYDLLEQKENEVLEEFSGILNKALQELHTDFILPSNKEVLLNIFICVYTYIKENSNFMKVVLGANGDLNFQMKVKTFIENSLVQSISINNDSEKMPIKYIAPFASSAQLGIMQKWLKSGMKETPEELALFVSNIIFTLYTCVIKDMII